jgi:mRNA interferase MazF
MKRGEIYFAVLNPTVGSEIQKTRPVLIVSNNIANKYSQLVAIVPITSQVKKVYNFEVFLDKDTSGLNKDSKVACHQIRTISKLRISGNKVGMLDDKLMNQVEYSLSLHLGIK